MLTKESFAWACTRMEEFYAVQRNGDQNSLTEAVTTLRESYGLTDDLLERLDKWTDDFCGERYTEPVVLGFLLGLMASEYEKW